MAVEEIPRLPVRPARRPLVGEAPNVLSRLPWWALVIIVLGLILGIGMATTEQYRKAFEFVQSGILVTIKISVGAYATALVIGLIAGLGRVSKNPIAYTLATLYVEIIRGIPLLVQVIVMVYLVVPVFINDVVNVYFVQWGLIPGEFSVQGFGLEYRAAVALAVGYGAYLAEIYRAGIQSISKGQMEAARSLGMTYGQSMRYVILPQAVRVILPPLGNDFIAMLKDSSLVSVASVQDLTFRGKLKIATSFDTFTTWYVVSYTYLTMTLGLSALVRFLERRTATPK